MTIRGCDKYADCHSFLFVSACFASLSALVALTSGSSALRGVGRVSALSAASSQLSSHASGTAVFFDMVVDIS